jgi:hypothetical protein
MEHQKQPTVYQHLAKLNTWQHPAALQEGIWLQNLLIEWDQIDL